MDAVSLASGIAGLITLALQVSGTIVQYTTAVKDRAKNVQELQAELSQLATVLSQLRDFLREQAGRDRDMDERLVLDKAVFDCKARIERVQSKLLPSQGGKLSRAWDKMTWPFEQKEVERLVESLRRFVHTFEFAVNIRGCSMLSKTSEEVAEVLEKTRESCEMTKHIPGLEAASIKTSSQVQAIIELLPTLLQQAEEIKEINNAVKLAEEREHERRKTEILEWLAPETSFHKHSETQKRRAPGTGQWFLQHPRFTDWAEAEKARHDLLCVGGPGRGKTVLCSLVIDHLRVKYEDDPNTVVAHYYCDFSEHQAQTASHLARCVLRQLCQRSKTVPAVVQEFWRETKNEMKDLLWSQRLQEVLRRIVVTFARCFIVIDAFDETDPNDQRKGLFDILGIIQASNKDTRVFVTTRPNRGIEHNFPDAPQIEVSADEKDLRHFLKLRIEEHPYSREVIDAALKDEILLQLCSHADGMFLLPALQIKGILGQVTKSAVRRALTSLSSDLTSVFGKTMERIGSLATEERELAYSTLMWISHASRPLTVQELQHAIAIRVESDDIDRDDIPSVRRILDSCCGLVEHDDESSYIKFVHFSLYEHLRDEKHGLFANSHLTVTQACLRYLTYRSLIPLASKNRNAFIQALVEWPFLDYAAAHWGFHAQGLKVADYQDLAFGLLNNGRNLLVTARVRDLNSPNSRKWNEKVEAWAFSEGGGISLASSFGLTELTQLLINQTSKPVLTARNLYGSTPLHECAMHGFDDTAQVLIKHGARLLDLNSGRATPFYLAISYEQKNTAAMLLSYDRAQLDAACKNGYTALHKACDSGSDLMVDFLIHNHATIDARDDHGWTPLHLACQRGYQTIVHSLVVAGASVAAKSREGLTPLDMACTGGYAKIVEYLLEHNAPVNDKCRTGWAPLHRAARRGHSDVAQLLLSRGAQVMAFDCMQRTPLVHAIKSGNITTVKILLEHDRELTLRQIQHKEYKGSSTKTVAFYSAHYNIHKYLRDTEKELLGHDPTLSLITDPTVPLTQAIEEGSLKKVQAILQSQPELLTRPDSSGQTPLHTAFQEQNKEIAEFILDQGVSIDIRGYHNWSPLHIAASLGSISLLSLALSCDANIHAITETLQTALHKAASSRSLPVVMELLRCGCDPATRNDMGMTPIHVCAHQNFIEGAREMLKPKWASKTLVFLTDKNHRSPRWWAERNGHLEMAAFLRLVERKAKNRSSIRNSPNASKTSLLNHEPDNLPLSRQTTLVGSSRRSTVSSFLSPPIGIGKFSPRQSMESLFDDDDSDMEEDKISPARTPTLSRTQTVTPIEDSSFLQMEQRYALLEFDSD